MFFTSYSVEIEFTIKGEMYLLLSQLWHLNQRACALFKTLKHKTTLQGRGETLG